VCRRSAGRDCGTGRSARRARAGQEDGTPPVGQPQHAAAGHGEHEVVGLLPGDRGGQLAGEDRRSRIPDIVERAKREHPYEIPGVSTRPINDGNPDYLGWIMQETE
jgi:hypothetical protein